MQKSVFVPFEKYNRLIELSTTPNKDTADAATDTESLPKPSAENKKELFVTPIEEKPEPAVEGESPLQQTDQLGRNLEPSKPLKKKRQRRSRPPGIKDYKSMWIKLNGRL